ncbi:hypothetical protein D9758_002532 [Tetrapyrgos nigripes]|uniref:Pet127-domain-containing protein n=1 Tax=Tetrapyrgos nigripes TaxID=182062 RepID=A0A8H5GQZ8_9AGAR|nr:hypothetical protein D9758_002532 [Tetrapyrgos nigripes]
MQRCLHVCSRLRLPARILVRSNSTASQPGPDDAGPLYESIFVTKPPLKRPKKHKRDFDQSALAAVQAARQKAEKDGQDIVNHVKNALVEAANVDPVVEKQRKRKAKRQKRKEHKRKAAGINNSWPKENWKNDWGEDQLKPKIRYSRKLEGLVEDVAKPVLEDLTPPTKQNPIAKLSHGLERVLFNSGVHWLRDPRSGVYNFSPALEIIPKVVDFAFEKLTGFVKSSRDEDLRTLTKREQKKFSGSTSSLSGLLSQIYFLISADRRVDISPLSLAFKKEPVNFTPGQRMPASIIFNYKDGVYAIDSDPRKSDDVDKNILTWMGTLLEKYLTMSSEEFITYLRSHPTLAEALEDPNREAYRYSKSDKFVMRSQLDCVDTRLPGTGVFDIKTRACLPIRMDLLNYGENSGYLIQKQHGLLESFEREYYDLIRSAFLNFQVRIGNMDGVLVAYHNTERMFGFQYVPLEEMDARLFGSQPGAGDRVFQKCVKLMEVVSEEIVSCFPGQSVRCTIETEEGSREMNIWVEPLHWIPGNAEKSTETLPVSDPPTMAPRVQEQKEATTTAVANTSVEESTELVDESRPIKQLVVSANSFSGNRPSKAYLAVEDMTKPWTVHWSVMHLTGGPEREQIIRNDLLAAQGRQYRAYQFPEGVNSETIRAWWEGVDFARGIDENQRRAVRSLGIQPGVPPIDGEAQKATTVTEDGAEIEVDISTSAVRKPDSFFEENFQPADERIEHYRNLARRGRELSIQRASEERGKPKLQLGVGEVPWEENELDTLLQMYEEDLKNKKKLEALQKRHKEGKEQKLEEDEMKTDNSVEQDAAGQAAEMKLQLASLLSRIDSSPQPSQVGTTTDSSKKGEADGTACTLQKSTGFETIDTIVKPLEEPRSLSGDPSRPASLHGDVTATALADQPVEGEEALFATDDSLSVKTDLSPRSNEKPSEDSKEGLSESVQEGFAEERVRLPEQAHQAPVEIEEPSSTRPSTSLATEPHSQHT